MMHLTDTTAQRAIQLCDGSRSFRDAIAIALGGVFKSGDICRWVFPDNSAVICHEDYSKKHMYYLA